FPRGIQHIQHMRNTAIRFCNSLQAMPYFAALGNEVVIRIDHQERGDIFVICHFSHATSTSTSIRAEMSSTFSCGRRTLPNAYRRNSLVNRSAGVSHDKKSVTTL